MTFAEIIILVLFAGLIFFILSPLQKKIENRLYRFFRSKKRSGSDEIIDVTDYSKKDNK